MLFLLTLPTGEGQNSNRLLITKTYAFKLEAIIVHKKTVRHSKQIRIIKIKLMDGTHQSRLNRHLKEISRLVDAQKIHEIKNLKSVCNALNPQILHYYHDRNSRENSKAIIESQSPSSHFRSLLPIKKPLKGSRIHCEYSNGRATPFTLHTDGHSTR